MKIEKKSSAFLRPRPHKVSGAINKANDDRPNNIETGIRRKIRARYPKTLYEYFSLSPFELIKIITLPVRSAYDLVIIRRARPIQPYLSSSFFLCFCALRVVR